jgi:hypothetical protein
MAEDINAPPKKLDLRFDEWLFRFWAKYQGVQVLANLLSSLGNGIIAKTGTGAFSVREIEGTTNEITVTNGNGVSANPVVSLPSSIVTPGSLTTTTDLTVNGNTTLGNDSTDTTTVNSTLRVAVSGTGLQGFLLDGTKSGADTFKINPTVSDSGGIGFLQGIHNTSLASSGAYQFLPVVTGNSNLNGYSGTLFRLDSDTGLVGPTTSVSTISISAIGPTLWQGSVPSSYRQISVGNVSIASTLIAGVSSSIIAGTGKWNFYAEGTAQNYFAGNTAYGNTNLQSVFFNTAGVTPRLQVIGTDSASSGILSYRASNNNASAYIALAKSRGASVGTNTIVQNNDQLGRVSFLGADGTNYISAGWIQGEVDGTPGTNDMPGRLGFYTTSDGSNLPTERVRINSSGLTTLGLNVVTGVALSTSVPAKLYSNPATYTDGITAASGTVAHGTINSFDNPAIAATNSTVTYTNASTVYIDGAPTNGTNVTITNPYSLFVNSGNTVHGGNNSFGKTTAPTVAVDVNGAVLATTSITSSGQTSGIGYSTGAGSTVTQGSGSGKATAVTLNRVCGQITMDSATLNAATAVSFTLNNTAIATTDVVIVNIDSGATTNSYIASVEAVGANSCQIQLYNFSASNLSEAVVINFAVIKSVTA